MITNLDRYKNDLKQLIDTGDKLLYSLYAAHIPDQFAEALKRPANEIDTIRKALPVFASAYQRWYSEAKALVRQLLPDRLDDFVRHYEKPKSRKALTFESYRIEDCLQNLVVSHHFSGDLIAGPPAAIPHFEQQLEIVKAIQARFESSLFDIRLLVQADLFDSELDAARELSKKGFLRAAGAVVGVVLEKHLAQVVLNHKLSGTKKRPTISDFNDVLKNNGVLDTPEWRRVQRLGDIRNLCDHPKGRDPTKDEIDELITGVDRITKALF